MIHFHFKRGNEWVSRAFLADQCYSLNAMKSINTTDQKVHVPVIVLRLTECIVTANPTHMLNGKNKKQNSFDFSQGSYNTKVCTILHSETHKHKPALEGTGSHTSFSINVVSDYLQWIAALEVRVACKCPVLHTFWYLLPPDGGALASHPAFLLAQWIASLCFQLLIHSPVVVSLEYVYFAIGPGEGCMRSGWHSSEEHAERLGVES